MSELETAADGALEELARNDAVGQPTDAREYLRDMVESDPALEAQYERLSPRFMVIGELVRARKALGITQCEMAARMGVSQPVVARLLSGDQSPRIDTIAAAAAALGCDLVIELRPRAASAASTRAPRGALTAVAEEPATYEATSTRRRKAATAAPAMPPAVPPITPPRAPRAPRGPRGDRRR